MKKIAAFFCLFVILELQPQAQKIETALNGLTIQNPTEKIYIHYDKDYYAIGETIWFKAYLYNNGLPSNESSNFFLHLVDENGVVISKKYYPVQAASVSGSLEIPDSLPQGYYEVRAITPTMLEQAENSIYSKSIFIINPQTKKGSLANPGISPQAILQFFPESGQLVNDIVTTIAFKAVDNNGNPVNIKGVIKTVENAEIISFRSLHDGMGRFQFRPAPGKKYFAALEGYDRSYPLPEIRDAGINLAIQEDKKGKTFLLTRSVKDSSLFSDLLLAVEINNTIIYEIPVNFGQYLQVRGHLSVEEFPERILKFTVYNKDRVPLAERLSFNYKINNSTENISIIRKGTKPREENIIDVNFTDSLQKNCSVSITDSDDFFISGKENIQSRLLLTNELKGYIHNPGYYFGNDNDTIRLALDNVLLTHGWSRYNWNKSAEKSEENRFINPHLIQISGTVMNEKGNETLAGGKLIAFMASEDSSLYQFETNVSEKGHFIFDSLLIVGQTKVYYTYLDSKGKNKAVQIFVNENQLIQKINEILPHTLSQKKRPLPDSIILVDIINRQRLTEAGNDKAEVLENVTVKTNYVRPVDIVNEKYTSPIFRTGGRVIIDNITNKPPNPAMSAFDFVKNRISTIDTQFGRFVNKKNFSLIDGSKNETNDIKQESTQENDGQTKRKFDFGNASARENRMRFWEVGLYINEMPADLIQLKGLRADQVALVKFFEAGFVGSGSSYPGGALAVYINYGTNNNKSTEKPPYFLYKGYSIIKEFYSPDYADPKISLTKKDFRTTLYWNPNLFTEPNSKSVRIRFFNNDISKRFRILIEGFDARGRLIHIEKQIGE